MNVTDKFIIILSADDDTKILYQNFRMLIGFDTIFDIWCSEGYTFVGFNFNHEDLG